MPFLAVLLNSFPESVLLIYLGLAFAGGKVHRGKILSAGAISALISWGVRALPVPFGVHTVIGVFVLALVFVLFFRFKTVQALFTSVFVLTTLIVIENLLAPMLMGIAGVNSLSAVLDDLVLRILIPIPEFIILSVIAALLFRHPIFNEKQTIKDGHNETQY